MGSHALLSLLHKHSLPQVKCLGISEAESLRSNVLLVDATAVCNLLCKRCGTSNATSTALHAPLYKAAVSYFRGLLRTGLRLKLFADSTVAPMGEQRLVGSRQHGAAASHPTLQMVFSQAVADLGLDCKYSVHAASRLLLAWHMSNKDQVYAVLSDDSDYFVYGVEKVVDPNDIIIDPRSVTLHIHSSKDAWQRLSAFATGRMPTPVPLIQRAQVAVMLSNSHSKDVWHRLSSRLQSASNNDSQGKGRVMSAALAGMEVLRQGGGLELDLGFFQKEPLNMRNFDEESLSLFNSAVQEYIKREAWARMPQALESILASPESLSWLSPHLVQHLTQHIVPPVLRQLACRGLAFLHVQEPHWSALQEIRRAAANQLGPHRGAVFEFDPNSHTLHQLSHAVGETPSDWFIPPAELPDIAIKDSCQGAAPMARAATLLGTAQTIRGHHTDLPESLVIMYAILLHSLDPDAESAYSPSAVRELLLPGMPPLSAEDEQGDDSAEVVVRPPWQDVEGPTSGVVEVGSLLSEEDWDDIDEKEVVANMQAGAGYALMNKIQPWDPLALAVPSPLPMSKLFRFFYNWAQKQETPWKELMKACFPEQYKETKKGDKADVKALKKELTSLGPAEILAELKKEGARGGTESAPSAYAALWAERLQSFIAAKSAKGMLQLWRDAATAGPGSIQWITAQICWSQCSSITKKQALVDAWSCDNRPQLNNGGPPMRYPHQQALLDFFEKHLEEVEANTKAGKLAQTVPLHIILSTPTGSGKTFTAVMTYLKLLKAQVDAVGNVIKKGHPDTILVYSVPTKQVLKRVGQECEAHKIVYWTAAHESNLFKVRRPYSIRTVGRSNAVVRDIGKGPMHEQLDKCANQGKLNKDIGDGVPSFIVADLYSTAAIMQVAAAAPPDAFYHHSKLLLYFDEPNMGIHLDAGVHSVVRSIMQHAPATAVLASATLPSWDALPSWWKGQGQPATRTVITQEPYSLPMSKLCVLDKVKGQLAPVNALQLFRSYEEFVNILSQSPRLRVLVMRHFTSAQANDLVGLKELAQSLDVSTSGAEAGEPAGSEGLSAVLGQDVASLREGMLEPELQQLTAERFTQLRDQSWAEPTKETLGMREVLSKQGVTLIATREPRAVALELAGKWADEARWNEVVHSIRNKIAVAKENQRQAAKESRRTQKKDDDEGMGAPMGAETSTRVTLRTGLWIDLEEANETPIDVLVMLAKGVAYASCDGTEPLIKRLYQQALLHVPEKAGNQPPINVLVVDYSSVYGTDCPAVDVIILCEDLGKHMNWEDHQQFIGRLRRDGTCIYPSLEMLRWATVRSVRPVGSSRDLDLFKSGAEELTKVFTRYVEGQASAGAQAAAEAEMLEVSKSWAIGKSSGRAEVACCVLAMTLRSLLPLPPAEETFGDTALTKKAALKAAVNLLKTAQARLKSWGPLQPIKFLQMASTPGEQKKVLLELEKLCSYDIKSDRPNILLPQAPGGAEYLPVAAKIMETLYDADVFDEDVVLSWAKSSKTEFRKAVEPFIEWLEEADDEDEDE